MKFLIMNSTDTKDFKATSNQKLVSFKKGIKRKRVDIPHSKMRDTLMGSAKVSTSLQNLMSGNECWIQTTCQKSLKKELINAKQFLCLLYLTNIY